MVRRGVNLLSRNLGKLYRLFRVAVKKKLGDRKRWFFTQFDVCGSWVKLTLWADLRSPQFVHTQVVSFPRTHCVNLNPRFERNSAIWREFHDLKGICVHIIFSHVVVCHVATRIGLTVAQACQFPGLVQVLEMASQLVSKIAWRITLFQKICRSPH